MLEQQLGNENNGNKKKRKRIRKKLIKNQNNLTEQKEEQIQQCQNRENNLDKNNNITIKEQTIQLNQPVNSKNNDMKKQTQPFSDEISHISKCQDKTQYETDLTFQTDFIKNQKTQDYQYTNKHKQYNIFQTQNRQKVETKNSLNEFVQQQNHNYQQKQKKKSKKQRQIDEFHDSIIKSIKNGAFTEFIDTISIDSNNLYNYKLVSYQFIAFFISSLLPPTNITLFGSNAVGLSLASSDIDIMINNNRWCNITQVRQVLYQIGNQISKMGWVVDYKLILNAKVPVLKLFIDPKIGYFDISPLKYATDTILQQSILIKADIIVNIEGQQNIGCQSTILMKQCLTEHPQLQRIILFFKYLLWYYGLNENYRGGICSYCLFLMVINCLFKNKKSKINLEKKITLKLNDQDQGSYILQILRYYSEQFNSKNDQIYISQILKNYPSIKIQTKNKTSQPSKRNINLRIIDPINGQYIESSFSKFQQIQQLFSMLLVQSLKANSLIKKLLQSHQQINQQFLKLQNIPSNLPFNVITKNNEQNNTQETKIKKLIKKSSMKLKRNSQVNYSVKQIVSIGFQIGIDNWMKRNFQERF